MSRVPHWLVHWTISSSVISVNFQRHHRHRHRHRHRQKQKRFSNFPEFSSFRIFGILLHFQCSCFPLLFCLLLLLFTRSTIEVHRVQPWSMSYQGEEVQRTYRWCFEVVLGGLWTGNWMKYSSIVDQVGVLGLFGGKSAFWVILLGSDVDLSTRGYARCKVVLVCAPRVCAQYWCRHCLVMPILRRSSLFAVWWTVHCYFFCQNNCRRTPTETELLWTKNKLRRPIF